MAKIEVNSTQFDISKENDELLFDGKKPNYDIIKLPNGDYHLVLDNLSYNITVNHKDTSSGALSLTINGREINTTLNNKLAELLKSMGMETGKRKQKELKAPMPGLVLDVLANAGDEVIEGQDLLVLEAMKMENTIKSPQNGVLESVEVKNQDKVEKNQVLVTFQ